MSEQENRKQLGKRIKMQRVEKDMNQAELAEKIHLKQSQLSQVERGLLGLSVDQLRAIAKALGCTAAYLLGEEKKAA